MSGPPPTAPHYTPAPETQVHLEYAELPIIDLSRAATHAGRLALAHRVRDAMSNQGFFYVINHGYTMAQTERAFDIADIPFSQVDEEEKRLYVGNIKEEGTHQGYKLRQFWHIDGGVWDQLEQYNINRDVTKRQHPKALRPFLPEIDAFARHNHENVLHPVLRLLALGLELPEDSLVNLHRFSAVGETSVRFIKYYPRSEDDEIKSKNVWLKGHTDFGTVTILYSQPVAGLQILTKDGSWKWVKHIENGLVINAGDALEFLSAGFYKATIHRVVQPPLDQQNYTRLGAFYFGRTDDDVRLSPLMDSPVLQRLRPEERKMPEAGVDSPTMEQWRKKRTVTYGRTELKRIGAREVEEEIIDGVVVRHYN